MSDLILPTEEQIKKAAENQRLYGAFNPFGGASLESPIALTEDHIPSLERAIRAEGYDIRVDTETGEVKLYRSRDRDQAAVAAMYNIRLPSEVDAIVSRLDQAKDEE